MFQQRHYEFLAAWIANATLCTTDPMARNLVASSLADRLERDNPRFKRAKFLTACAYHPWVEPTDDGTGV